MQRSSCDDDGQLDETIMNLQDKIVVELTLDPRVGDAYIQRILMLLDSGATERVKPAWIQRVIEAKNPDGGWDDFDPIAVLPGGLALGFTRLLPTIDSPWSNLHATAQAIWLLSILLSQQ